MVSSHFFFVLEDTYATLFKRWSSHLRAPSSGSRVNWWMIESVESGGLFGKDYWERRETFQVLFSFFVLHWESRSPLRYVDLTASFCNRTTDNGEEEKLQHSSITVLSKTWAEVLERGQLEVGTAQRRGHMRLWSRGLTRVRAPSSFPSFGKWQPVRAKCVLIWWYF